MPALLPAGGAGRGRRGAPGAAPSGERRGDSPERRPHRQSPRRAPIRRPLIGRAAVPQTANRNAGARAGGAGRAAPHLELGLRGRRRDRAARRCVGSVCKSLNKFRIPFPVGLEVIPKFPVFPKTCRGANWRGEHAFMPLGGGNGVSA